jgi:hypothetical protein
VSLGGDLLVEAEVLFDGGDADFKLESLVDFVFLELQLGVEAFDVVFGRHVLDHETERWEFGWSWVWLIV